MESPEDIFLWFAKVTGRYLPMVWGVTGRYLPPNKQVTTYSTDKQASSSTDHEKKGLLLLLYCYLLRARENRRGGGIHILLKSNLGRYGT
jgi:hypothetical protein